MSCQLEPVFEFDGWEFISAREYRRLKNPTDVGSKSQKGDLTATFSTPALSRGNFSEHEVAEVRGRQLLVDQSRFLQWTSKRGGSDMAENTIDYTKMELGRVTRTFKGKSVERITRCAKCGEHGARSVFIPEKRSGARPYVSWHHVGRVVNAVSGFTYFSIDKSCTAKLSVDTSEDLLNIAERKEYDAWREDMHAFVDGTDTTQKASKGVTE